jgi:hypothetical protein
MILQKLSNLLTESPLTSFRKGTVGNARIFENIAGYGGITDSVDEDVPLIDSIPYLKNWILQHQGRNPNSILLCGFGKSIGRTKNVSSSTLDYTNFIERSSSRNYYKTRMYRQKITDDATLGPNLTRLFFNDLR